ncbi:uncharacterized protein N7518_001618 [Penicillium psychrosexuale]|uniref:uncharacterized protein n=1 Tax=Penicillium psychrosexuale TaxID=1002107 RepID=UPI0025455663|nr:uncharacterized protein N7518_001618 [Penicillium psychrosexuale]KAJ5799550.1 hypothetical protein N7518_001618 [Penicillium psychrosexuale]
MQANILGQLETAGTEYFEGFVAVPGTRARIETFPEFVPVVTATAINVDSPYVHVVLNEETFLDATVQLMTPDNGVSHNFNKYHLACSPIYISVVDSHYIRGHLIVTADAIHAALQAARFSFATNDWRYVAMTLEERIFVGEGEIFVGQDGRVYITYTVNEEYYWE